MLFLATSLLLAVRPVATQDIPSPEARRTEILRLVLRHGEGRLEAAEPLAETPPEAYLMLNSAGQPSYAEGSLEYAAALLMSGADAARATRIIETVLAAQAAGGKCPGGFPWRPGTEADAYATAFLAPWLAYIHQHLVDGLPEDLRTALSASLRPALGAVQRFSVRADEPQALMTKLAAEATLSAALNDSEAKTKAAADFAAWLKQVSEEGFATAQKPTATVVTAAALNWIWLAAPSDEAKQGAAAALEYLYRDLALRYQPKAAMVAGAVTAGHYGDYAAGTGSTRYLLYAQFGRPELTSAEPFAMFLAVPGFAPNEETVALARAVDAPRMVRVRTADRTMTTYVHSQYALGTMTGPVADGAAAVVLTYGPEGEPGAYCTVAPTPARVAAVQNAGQALVDFDVDDVGFANERLFVGAEFHLGLKSSLNAVLVNQAPYTQDFAVAVETRGSVVTERDGIYTAVIPIVMGPASPKSYDQPVGPAELSWVPVGDGREQELVLKMNARTVRGREPSRNNYRIGFAVEMASREDYTSVDEFAQAIYDGRRAKQEVKTRQVKIGERTDNPRRPELYRRPKERGEWIFETRVVQDMTYTSEGASLQLTEDLEQNQVVEQLVNGSELLWDSIYRSPALNHLPGDALNTVLRPPPPEPAPETSPEEAAPAAPQ